MTFGIPEFKLMIYSASRGETAIRYILIKYVKVYCK